ncbi:sensor histidine kinase [Azospira sp. I13]|nr:sensor histidine kinase [Azospira sp. I13]
MAKIRLMMTFPSLRHSFCAVLLSLFAGLAAAGEVRLGVLAWLGSEEAEVQWAPLAQALQQRLPGQSIVLRHYDLAGMAAALRAGELEFAVTNPGHYVTLEAETGLTRIATQVGETSQNPAHAVGSAVVVLDRRLDLQRLEDLRGGNLAAVAADAFGGYQLAWAELQRLGLAPEEGNPQPHFTGFPMSRVVDAVLAGEADAGVLRACLLERLEQSGAVAPGRLRVLAQRPADGPCRVTTRLYPGWAFAAAPATDPALSRQVLLALLSMPPDAGGLSWTVPADYHPVHELLRQLRIGPYAFLRETGWDSLWQRYWPWVAGLLMFLLAWGVYTLRVEHLVQRRTRELSSALAERHRLEAQVHAGQQQMDHLSRLSILGELAGTLAHELNQPLATMGNYARSLLRRQQSGTLAPEALTQAAEEIANESERAAGILAGIRAMSRKRSRVREVWDLAELVQAADRLLHGMAPRGPAIVLGELPAAAERQVEVDPLQIQQVLLNLFKNAWDAQQSLGCTTPIEVSLSLVGERCGVAVRDHGPGLTPELRARLFEPFFTTKPDGLGLGLSICKTIIEAHGGELQAWVPPSGPGLIFHFTLPRAPLAVPAPTGSESL